MSKQILMEQIVQKYSLTGIPYRVGQEADIQIKAEFSDAGFSSGNKKINYEATIFMDESTQTVYM